MARYFNGSNEHVDFGDVTELDAATLLSFHLWVNVPDALGTHALWGKKNTGGAASGLIIKTLTGDFQVQVKDDADAAALQTAGTLVVADTWTSVGVTFKASDASGLNIYVGGSLDSNSPGDMTAVGAFQNNSADLKCARIDEYATWDTLGTIGEVACWVGVILSLSEFQQLAAGTPAYRIQPSYLQFYSPLGKASPEPNYGVAGGTGTVTGSTVVAGPYIIRPDDTKLITRGIHRGLVRGAA